MPKRMRYTRRKTGGAPYNYVRTYEKQPGNNFNIVNVGEAGIVSKVLNSGTFSRKRNNTFKKENHKSRKFTFNNYQANMPNNWVAVKEDLYGTRYFHRKNSPEFVSQYVHPSNDPLPDDWSMGYNTAGNPFFTRPNATTTRNDPRNSDLPTGWKSGINKQYGKRYFYGQNGAPQWEKPTA